MRTRLHASTVGASTVGAGLVRAILVGAALAMAACAGGDDGLRALHADIAADYPTVAHIDTEALARLDNPVILDIRDPEEFAVSRIPGAVRVDLDADVGDVLARVRVRGRPVVAYCSVGRRSSIFAERAGPALRGAGAASVANLEGGVFRWHGEWRGLVDDDGITDAVHPYDEIWKRYVVRPDAARYEAEP